MPEELGAYVPGEGEDQFEGFEPSGAERRYYGDDWDDLEQSDEDREAAIEMRENEDHPLFNNPQK